MTIHPITKSNKYSLFIQNCLSQTSFFTNKKTLLYVVGVSTSQYCDNCVRLGGVGGGLAIGKVDSWGIFYV